MAENNASLYPRQNGYAAKDGGRDWSRIVETPEAAVARGDAPSLRWIVEAGLDSEGVGVFSHHVRHLRWGMAITSLKKWAGRFHSSRALRLMVSTNIQSRGDSFK
jgi:hypothetical protein